MSRPSSRTRRAMRRAEIMGRPLPRMGAEGRTTAVDSRGPVTDEVLGDLAASIAPTVYRSDATNPGSPPPVGSAGKGSHAALDGAAPERAGPAPPAHAAVVADGEAVRVEVGRPVPVGRMPVHDAAGAGALEPRLQS